MNTHIVTREQIDSEGNYIGKVDLSNYDGNIEIAENLGWVGFTKNLIAKGYILAKAGSGIKAGGGIEAGDSIEAGGGIEAGYGIEAGGGIEAGDSIKAGDSIECKLSLSVGLRIFAGTSIWRNSKDAIKSITCGKLEKGEICYGELKEIGLPKTETSLLSGKIVKVEIDGIKYEAVLK